MEKVKIWFLNKIFERIIFLIANTFHGEIFELNPIKKPWRRMDQIGGNFNLPGGFSFTSLKNKK